jgi:high-affinity iron transporter
MLQAFVITLREGLEAFLIVAISLAYLRKTGRGHLLPAVHWGIVTAILASIGLGLLLQRARNQALWEGILALTAAVLVASLIVHMWRAARHIRRQIEAKLQESAVRRGAAAFLGVFLFTVLMISREGMETALLMNALLFQVQSTQIIAGAVAGTLCAAFVAWLWSRYGHRVNLGRFFQVTAVFLMVFVVQLVIYGFHELTEANILPYSETLHWKTEAFGPDGRYGQYFSYLLVAVPMGWLAVSSIIAARRSARTVETRAA